MQYQIKILLLSRLLFPISPKSMSTTKRKLISFEGGEGSGKSTQIPLLESYFHNHGEKVLLLREPGDTTIGERIRQLLQHDVRASGMFPETELLLFEASRAQLVRERILPALAEGTWVLCDRFFDSTTAYQGAGRQIPLDAIHWLNRFAIEDCVPALTFFFDLSPDIGQERVRNRTSHAPEHVPSYDRIEKESLKFFQAVREGYRRLTADEPQRFITIDAQLDPVDIAQTIRQHVHEHFFS
jgi:dTMP kinase